MRARPGISDPFRRLIFNISTLRPLHPDFKVCESLPEVTSATTRVFFFLMRPPKPMLDTSCQAEVPLGTSTEFLDEKGGQARENADLGQ